MRALKGSGWLFDQPRSLQPICLQGGHPVVDVLVELLFGEAQTLQRNLAQLSQALLVTADHGQPESSEPVPRVSVRTRTDGRDRAHLVRDTTLHCAVLVTCHCEESRVELHGGNDRFPCLHPRGARVDGTAGLEMEKRGTERHVQRL
jgi:hypothetical protein